ncbi:hypothetical protein ACTJKK_09060 [Microbacterium sp. 22179]|uniref:hypothetical protein n=1 Tax=Microbacterium sp. 22179 TaxID=3453886 RepID=UPI003F863355
MSVVLLIGIAAIAGVIVSQNNRPEAVPTSSEDSAPAAPDADDDEIAPEEESSTPPSDTGGESADVVIQSKIDEYKRARQNGSLWQQIPDNEFNQTAVSAFLYLLTDMKVAAIWGADPSEYLDEVAELERKLLAQEPLGSDIEIILSDRTFTYDGDTGEGGYTDN